MPAWLNDAVFYEIYPQSFCDTNGDGIGDFQGIIDKLPYIKALGCNAIWMNPCFDSPFWDAGYDVRNYKLAAERYGTNADLKRLFDTAHGMGMHVILDLVPGHTSDEHPWFEQSVEAEENEYSGRYIWTDSVWETLQGIDNIAGELRGISKRDGTVATNFFSTQPALNYGFATVTKPWQCTVDSPEATATREAMMDVMRFWLSLGCDGFRVDMAGSLIKADPGQQETIKLWQRFRAFLDEEFPEAAMISEWGMPDRSLAGGFHMDFLLAWGDSQYTELFRTETPYFGAATERDAAPFVKRYEEYRASIGGKGLICIPSGNHDTPRISHTLTDRERRAAFTFLLTMPGAPFIYYGDEIGMKYLPELTSVEGGYHRTGTRTPMQWDHTANSGFSAAPGDMLYIPMDPDPKRPTVKDQMADPGSLWSLVHELLTLRAAHPALQTMGALDFVSTEEGALVYLRSEGDEKLLVAINPKNHAAHVILAQQPGEVLFLSGEAPIYDDDAQQLTLAPESACVLRMS